jgi:hypothetical protein
VNAAEHLAEAERLVERARSLNGNYRDRDDRLSLVSEEAAQLAALATAHASIAAAMEAQQARESRSGI